MVRASYPPRDICVVWVGGEAYAIEDTCSHGEASLSRGRVRGYSIACPAHGYVFSLLTGERSAPRIAGESLCNRQKRYITRVEGEEVVILEPSPVELIP